MADRETAGEPPEYLARASSAHRQASQDDNIVSRSMTLDSDDSTENSGTLGLPQTYRGSSISLGQADRLLTSGNLQHVAMTASTPFRNISSNLHGVDVTVGSSATRAYPTSAQSGGISSLGGGGSIPLMNFKQRSSPSAVATGLSSGGTSNMQQLPQTAITLSSTPTTSHAASTSLLRETLQLPHSALTMTQSVGTPTTAVARCTLMLPQTAATQSPALSVKESLHLPNTVNSQLGAVNVPPSPAVRHSLQLPRTGMTPPPSGAARESLTLPHTTAMPHVVPSPASVRESLTLPHTAVMSALASPVTITSRESLTLPHTAVMSALASPVTLTSRESLTLPRTVMTPSLAPPAKELQLPHTASVQPLHTADTSMSAFQIMSSTTSGGRQVLHLPKSDISSLGATSTPRDTLQLPKTSAPPASDGSRVKLQLPSTSDITTHCPSPAHQGSDVIRGLLQLPQTSHTSRTSGVTISVLGQSSLPAISVIKKEIVPVGQSVSMVDTVFEGGDGGLHSLTSVLHPEVSNVNVEVHVPDHMTSVYSQGHVGTLQVSSGAVAGMAITKTEDGGKVIVAYAEDGRPLSTSRVEELPIHYAADDRNLRLPHTMDVGRMEMLYEEAGRNSVSYGHDDSAVSFVEDNPDVQYVEDMRVQVAYMEDGTRVNLVYEQQGDGYIAVAYTEDGRRITVPYTIETVPQSELNRVAAGINRKTEDITKMNAELVDNANTLGTQIDDVSRLGVHVDDVSRLGVHVDDVSRLGLPQQQMGVVRGVIVSQQSEAARYVSAFSESDLQMSIDRADVSGHTVSHVDAGRLVIPQMEIKPSNSSTNLAQSNSGTSVGFGVTHCEDMSMTTLPQTVVIDASLSHSGYLPMGAAAQYHDSPTLLPQTSNIQAMNLSQSSMPSIHSPNLPSSTSINRHRVQQQPPADDINMRMMAAAAEFMSQSSQPVDDVNMRLMAETADYISRSSQQASASAASSHPAVDISTPVLAQQSSGSPHANGASVSGILELSNRCLAASSYPNSRMEASVRSSTIDQTGVAVSLTQRMLKKEEPDFDVARGFREDFFKSQSYSRWKQIGKSQMLRSDEEIACFLMKYYGDTIGMFPNNSPTCLVCKRSITVTCLYCMKRAAGEDTDTDGMDDTDTDNDISALEDPRSKLWKIIVAAGKKEGKEATGNGDKQGNRRKPIKKRRVLRSSEGPSTADSDYKNMPVDNTTEHFEKQEDRKSFVPGARKRGRPSNDSYKMGDTLSCQGCCKKFHTLVGLEKHRKLKKCKLSEMSEDDVEVPLNKSGTLTDFKFECVNCKNRYRSKQGLVLHRVAKHSEISHKSQSALSDGEDTDDYASSTPAASHTTGSSVTPMSLNRDKAGMFQCDRCMKKYRSKQGLLLHKVSKHSESLIKTETIEQADVKPDIGMTTRSRRTSGSPAASGNTPGATSPAAASPCTDMPDTTAPGTAAHRTTPGATPMYECTMCKRKYNSRPGLMLHIKSKHSPQVLMSCQTCRQRFKTKLELRIHIRKDHSDGRLLLFCPYCPDTFSDRQVLKKHMADNHRTCRQTLYDCFGCDLQFSSRIERKRHIQSEHKGKDTSLTCHFCGQWFATRIEYSVHEKEGHNEQNQEWLCSTCGDALPTKYLLQRHTLTHKEKIDCELCGKSITEPCYDDHMKRHFGTKTWQCEVCPKSFIRKAELQQHMLVHKDERPYCCELCGVRYREKSRLNSHMRTHTGIKPYKCEQCEKCFTRSRELKNHYRVHTGEKPFSCSVCGRRFASSGNLSAHRRKVHKLSPIPHGMQSRKHMLEEKTKPCIQGMQEDQQQQLLPTPLLDGAMSLHEHQEGLDAAHHSAYPDSGGMPLAAGAPQEVHMPHPVGPLVTTHQAPAAHQPAQASHGDVPSVAAAAVALVYQQGQVLPKYEPVMTQAERYVPQTVIHRGSDQQEEQTVPIYWANTGYTETQ